MPASDRIHVAVRNALTKDGWTITEDPFTISYEEITVFADLFQQKAIQFLVSRFRVAIVVVNVEREQVAQWIK